jgi:hypothetical protein
MHAQQVEAGEHGAGGAAGEVRHVHQAHRRPAIVVPEPTGDCRQRGAHQHRRRREDEEADDRAKRDRTGAGFRERQINLLNVGKRERNREAQDRDACFEGRDDAKWMRAFRCQPGQQPAAERHPAHKRAQQDGDGDRRGADDELDEIEPDGFVNERRAAAGEKENQEAGHR